MGVLFLVQCVSCRSYTNRNGVSLVIPYTRPKNFVLTMYYPMLELKILALVLEIYINKSIKIFQLIFCYNRFFIC